MLYDYYTFLLEVLIKPKFSKVEKIKTIGSTYMAATGLNSTVGVVNMCVIVMWSSSSQKENSVNNIVVLCKYALEIIKKLDNINQNSFNNFQLRIGREAATPTSPVQPYPLS